MKQKPIVPPAHLQALRRFKADIFQVLAHPTRIHIIETLRERELSVGAILEEVKVEQANISQHLALLRSKRLVHSRKAKNQVLYSLRNPLLTQVLDIMRQYFLIHLGEDLGMLQTMEQEPRPRSAAVRTL